LDGRSRRGVRGVYETIRYGLPPARAFCKVTSDMPAGLVIAKRENTINMICRGDMSKDRVATYAHEDDFLSPVEDRVVDTRDYPLICLSR
jgi:hypothetical protein